MSSYYIFDADEKNTSITKNLDMKKYAIVNLKTYPSTNSSATSKKYVDDETKKLLDLAATRQMQDDLDMGNNSIVGVKNITASNSVVSKDFIESNFVKRKSTTYMEAHINMTDAYKILQLPNPTQDGDATRKKYVDDEIKKIHIPLVYHHTLGFTALSHNSWEYASAPVNTQPWPWLNCDGLNEKSYFELGVHTFDNDNSIPSTMTMEYRLQAFEANGTLRSWVFFNGNLKGYQIPSETIFCVNQKYYFKNFPSGNYKQFKVCRLSVNRKFSGTFGNESCVTFAIVR